MTKVQKCLTLDFEIYQAIKVSSVNVSELVNSLLSVYIEEKSKEQPLNQEHQNKLEIYKLALKSIEEERKRKQEEKEMATKTIEYPKSKEEEFEETVKKLREKHKEKTKIFTNEEYQEIIGKENYKDGK